MFDSCLLFVSPDSDLCVCVCETIFNVRFLFVVCFADSNLCVCVCLILLALFCVCELV